MLLIRNATAISLRDNLNDRLDVLIRDGKIAAVGRAVAAPDGAEILDGSGLCLAPGLVDLCARATEPEEDGLENMLTMSHAAARGGYTTVCAHTGARTPDEVERICERAHYAGCDIVAAARATDGRTLLPYGELRHAGAAVIYDDQPVADPMTMRDALFRARKYGVLLMSRCRDDGLCREGYMREGDLSRLTGVKSIPASCETVMLARDVILARESGSPVHIPHISTAQSVEIIRAAKAAGVPVTCSVEPPYFALTNRALADFDPMAKLDPPLGNRADTEAIIKGLADGTIDGIASGHTPIPREKKLCSIVSAAYGASSLETALAVSLTALGGRLELPLLLDKMSAAPAALLGLPCGRLRVGDDADLVLFDPQEEWECRAEEFVSLGKNTPFAGMRLTGRVKVTIKAGRVTARG